MAVALRPPPPPPPPVGHTDAVAQTRPRLVPHPPAVPPPPQQLVRVAVPPKAMPAGASVAVRPLAQVPPPPPPPRAVGGEANSGEAQL
eukprot:933780-Alexandrium_andersonii.AAC.1